jgi:hypothetical protein
MYTQNRPAKQSSTPVFIMLGEPEPSKVFVAGKCVCKNCHAQHLTFYRYLGDAKCECGQWQNEPLIND